MKVKVSDLNEGYEIMGPDNGRARVYGNPVETDPPSMHLVVPTEFGGIYMYRDAEIEVIFA